MAAELDTPNLEELEEHYSAYFKTEKTTDIKTIFDSMKELVHEVNIIFSPEGVVIKEIDDYDSVMVYLFMDNLTFYYCPKTVKIGISIPNFAKLLKNIGNSNTVCINIDKDSGQTVLNMEVDHGDPNQLRAWSINLMELDKSDEAELPDIEYTYSLELKSTDFKSIVQDAKAIAAKNLEITYNKGKYEFHAQSDIGEFYEVRRAQKIRHEFLDDDDDADDDEEPFEGIYTGQFDIERLTYSTKCTSVSKHVNLKFENDSPLIIDYDAAVGTYRLYLSPVDNDDD